MWSEADSIEIIYMWVLGNIMEGRQKGINNTILLFSRNKTITSQVMKAIKGEAKSCLIIHFKWKKQD